MENYSILTDNNRLVRLTKARDLDSLALIYLKWSLKQDGFSTSLSSENISKYLESWLEWSQEAENKFETKEEAIDEATSNLVYSNIHFLKNNTEISSKDREYIFEVIYSRLSDSK